MMKKKIYYYNAKWLIVSLTALFIDQISKQYIITNIIKNHIITINPWLSIVHTHNRGIAFGLFTNSHDIIFYILLLIAILTSIILLIILFTHENKSIRLPASLALGGALGNIFDKLQHGFVIDFIGIHYQQYQWPYFNLADSFIVSAAIIYIATANKILTKK